ncbi:MAG: hypothetical protein ACTSRU_20830, partial [Candidatus Hodarchaeales archaeon]
MAFFTYLPPEKEKPDSIISRFDDSTISPLFVKSSNLILDKGSIFYAVKNEKGLKAFGILSKDTLKVYIRPAAMNEDRFEKFFTSLLIRQAMPIWMLTDENSCQVIDLIDTLSLEGKIRKERILSLPQESLHGLLMNYPVGQVSAIERQLANPNSERSVKRLANRVEHAILCQLLAMVIHKMVFTTVDPVMIRSATDLRKYMVIDCKLPVTVKTTLVSLISTGTDSEDPLLISAGVHAGNSVRIYFNFSNDSGLLEHLVNHLRETCEPILVNNKRSALRILNLDEEKLVSFSKKAKLFNGLIDDFTGSESDIN